MKKFYIVKVAPEGNNTKGVDNRVYSKQEAIERARGLAAYSRDVTYVVFEAIAAFRPRRDVEEIEVTEADDA